MSQDKIATRVAKRHLKQGAALPEALKAAVTAAKSFMDVGAELKKAKIKYNFSAGDFPVPANYTLTVGGTKYGIVNKKYAEDPDFVIGDIAVGKM
jgi:hypothetical protein